MDHEKERAHVTHDERPDREGKPQGWWRIDFRSFQGIIAIASAVVIISAAMWGAFSVVAVSVFDPHIRRIVREEVPAAMQTLIDTAVVRAAIPHMEKARSEHERLQGEIDQHTVALSDIRTFRDKMFAQLAEQDLRQTNELAALRTELRELAATQRAMYELLLKIEANGKQEEKVRTP
jgi:hypothetical protein